jgi:hypothetical protein
MTRKTSCFRTNYKPNVTCYKSKQKDRPKVGIYYLRHLTRAVSTSCVSFTPPERYTIARKIFKFRSYIECESYKTTHQRCRHGEWTSIAHLNTLLYAAFRFPQCTSVSDLANRVCLLVCCRIVCPIVCPNGRNPETWFPCAMCPNVVGPYEVR